MRQRLSLRRFPDRIVRIRTTGRRVDGLWQDDDPAETTHRASVQPIEIESLPEVSGERPIERVKVFIPEPDALRAANDDGEADRVRWFNREYTVERSEDWGNGPKQRFTQAVLLRSF